MTIEQCVRQHAAEKPDAVAVICGSETLNYSQLWEAVQTRAKELERSGLGAGRLNIFRAEQSPQFLIDYMATHLCGAVAVPLERDCPKERFDALNSEYGQIVLPSSPGSEENIADVLFTTGSTGQQKGVMESYRAISADADNLIHAQGFRPDTVFIICGPLNHIGSLSKIWPTLMLGGALIILEGMKDIDAFVHAFDYPSNRLATFMVPASIRIVLQFGEEGIKRIAQKIDFIETGGAFISQTDMDALRAILPKARLYNTYASTETGIVCTYDYNHNPCVAGCTGPAMVNSEVFITPDGTIATKGKTIMSGYIGDKALTDSMLRNGTIYTCDLGEIDDNGWLHIKGRNNDVMNIGGYKVSPLEVEDVAIAFPEVTDCICFLTNSPIFGKAIKLVYTAADGTTISKKALATFIAARLESYKVPRIFEQADSIRHTYNGKLDRKSYK